MEHGALAQDDDRDLHRRPRLLERRLLEVPDHEGVEPLVLGLERVANDLGGAPELGDGVQVPIAWLDADHGYIDPWPASDLISSVRRVK